jgi:hypothetical protein
VHGQEGGVDWGVLAELDAAGLVTLADKGYHGSSHAKIPYRGKNKPQSRKMPTALTRLRTPGERPAQDVEDPAQAPLLPLACRAARQSHSRIADPGGITRMERVH